MDNNKKLSGVLSNDILKECSGGLTVYLITGLNNPDNQDHIVTAPPAANGGALNAFSHVLANTGGLSNIDVAFGP